MPDMPQAQNTFVPRKGQQDLIEYLPGIKTGDVLSVQWPTGYGKSIGFALAWKHCHNAGIANRFLLVVANDTQRQQVINDFAGDCELVEAPCPGGIWSFDRSAGDILTAKRGNVLVFVSTVQQLEASMSRGGVNTLKDMLQTAGTKWMIGFDEYHHYGEDMPWGDAAKLAMKEASFSLAMSATPYRRGASTIFPEPELAVTYAEGVDAKSVKPMVCHSYEYAVAVIQNGEEVSNYTTSELLSVAGGDIDAWEERKNIRYSPQYIQPLVFKPLQRLRQTRALTGKCLQMLVRAMSCRHAETLCQQIRTYADGLSVDWVGTNGRSEKENRDVLSRFCPPKGRDGARPEPTLDIMVQVAMAGEGFDSVNVCEIVDFFPVSAKSISGRATQDKQFYGRGARIVRGHQDLSLKVNIPSDHPLHAWAGKDLSQWMDACGDEALVDPRELPDVAPREVDPFYHPPLPPPRRVELITVITDTEAFHAFAKECCRRRGYSMEEDKQELEALFLFAANGIAERQSEQSRGFQVREYMDSLVGRMALVLAKQTSEISGAVVGRFKKEVNGRIKKTFGKSREEMTLVELEKAAEHIRQQLENMRGLGI